MDPDRLVARNRSWWTSDINEYELVYPETNPTDVDVLAQRRQPFGRERILSIARRLVTIPVISVTICWVLLCAGPFYFGASLIVDSRSGAYRETICTVVDAIGPEPYGANDWVCSLRVTAPISRPQKIYTLLHTTATPTTCTLYGASCDYGTAGSCSGPCWYVSSSDEIHTSGPSSTFEGGVITLVLSSLFFCCGLIGSYYAVGPKFRRDGAI